MILFTTKSLHSFKNCQSLRKKKTSIRTKAYFGFQQLSLLGTFLVAPCSVGSEASAPTFTWLLIPHGISALRIAAATIGPSTALSPTSTDADTGDGLTGSMGDSSTSSRKWSQEEMKAQTSRLLDALTVLNFLNSKHLRQKTIENPSNPHKSLARCCQIPRCD